MKHKHSKCNKCNGTLFVCENHPYQEAHECKHCCGAGMPCECTKISEPIGNTEQLAEPVACRYDFDGYGYMYMDAGSGSDWASRVKDCEFLYTHPMVSKSADMLRQQAKEIERLKLNLRLAMSDNSSLRKELEDCTCQGGHSEAYLKVKGKK